MKSLLCALPLMSVLALSGPASAGEASCVFERGVVIVPAEVLGVAGDYILDTGQARTQLALTQAESAGIAGQAQLGEVRVAGLARPGQRIEIVKLDARTVFQSTPIAGVIGVEALRDLVVDVRFSPCRVWIGEPDDAPRFRADRETPLAWSGGLPVVSAQVGDGFRAWPGEFAPSTGLDLAVRLDDRWAAAPAAAKPEELYPGGVSRARLGVLEFAGDRYTELDAGLVKAAPQTNGPAGWIGGPVLSRYRLRFDFPAGRLLLDRKR